MSAPAEHRAHEASHNAAQAEVDTAPNRKRFETLRAELALRGLQLLELSDGSYFICRWDRSFRADCLRGVSAFLTRIGGHA